MKLVLGIALGGAAGSLLRWWVQGAIQRWSGAGFPWGTFVVNVVGGFAVGLIATLFVERGGVEPAVRVALLAGLLGGFTTFSTYLWETDALWRDGRFWAAGANVVLSSAAGLMTCAAGVAVARWLAAGGRP